MLIASNTTTGTYAFMLCEMTENVLGLHRVCSAAYRSRNHHFEPLLEALNHRLVHFTEVRSTWIKRVKRKRKIVLFSASGVGGKMDTSLAVL